MTRYSTRARSRTRRHVHNDERVDGLLYWLEHIFHWHAFLLAVIAVIVFGGIFLNQRVVSAGW